MKREVFQEQVQQLLVRHGLGDEAATHGFECALDTGKVALLQIRSIAEAKLKPYTEWFDTAGLFTIRVGGRDQVTPMLRAWEDRGFPFSWLDTVDVKGSQQTLDVLDGAFVRFNVHLQRKANELLGREASASDLRSLATIYHLTGKNRLVRRGYVCESAIRWLAAGVDIETIVYAHADPFEFSTLVRRDKEPLFPLEDALSLMNLPLHTLAALYPFENHVR